MPTSRRIVALILTLGAFLLIAFAIAESHGPTAPPAQAAASGSVAWGDLNCSGVITPTDIQLVLNKLVGFTPLPAPSCPAVGSTVMVSGNPHIWGDVRCDTALDASDGLAIDAYILSQSLLTETPPCPDMGAVVAISDVGGAEPQNAQPQGVPATGTITLTVQEPPDAIGSLDVSLVYDDNLMTATGCETGFSAEACNETFASDTGRWAGANVGGLKGTVTIGTISFANYSQAGRDSITTTVNTATDIHGVPISLTVTVTGTTPPAPTPSPTASPVGSPTATPSPEQRLDAGYFHNCMTRTNQTVVCWGLNNFGETAPPAGTFTSVSAGYWLSCGVRTDQSVAAGARMTPAN